MHFDENDFSDAIFEGTGSFYYNPFITFFTGLLSIGCLNFSFVHLYKFSRELNSYHISITAYYINHCANREKYSVCPELQIVLFLLKNIMPLDYTCK